MKNSNFIKWLKSPKSDFALVIILLILVSLVGRRAFFRIDLTSSKSYSLSEASVRLVKNLTEPLSVHVFFSSDLPSPYNTNAQYVRDILSEYSGAANSNFHCQFYDMKSEQNETLATQFGLRRVQIQEVSNNEVGFKQAWMGLAISYSDAIQTIDGLTATSGLELRLTTVMSKMIATSDALAGLPEGDSLLLELFTSDELSQFGISGFAETEEIVRDAYINVNEAHQDRITFRHTKTSSDVDEISQRYGIQKIEWRNNDGSTGAGVIGLVLSHGDEFRTIPLSMQRSLFGYLITGLDDIEQSINGSIENLLSKTTEIGYITGHGELPLYSADPNESSAAPLIDLTNDMYSLTEINLADQNIPSNISSIIINGVKSPLSESEMYKIDQFIMRGGNVMFFVDSFSMFGGNSYYQQQIFMPIDTGIENWLKAYGVTVNKNYVMDEESYPIQNEQYGKMNLYWAPVIQKKQLAKKNPITDNLGYLIFLQTSSIDIDTSKDTIADAAATVLVRSSDKSWTVESNIQLNPMMVSPPYDKSTEKSENLAVIIEGKFKSAYDSAVEDETVEGNASDTNTLSAKLHIPNSIQPGKIFVAGTSLITTSQLIGENSTEPIAMFVRNVIDYMSGNEDLCSMRTKGLSLSSLENTGTPAAMIAQLFNQFGIAVLVAITGFIVWHLRNKRRRRISMRYNSSDSRIIDTKQSRKTASESSGANRNNDANENAYDTDTANVSNTEEKND